MTFVCVCLMKAIAKQFIDSPILVSGSAIQLIWEGVISLLYQEIAFYNAFHAFMISRKSKREGKLAKESLLPCK